MNKHLQLGLFILCTQLVVTSSPGQNTGGSDPWRGWDFLIGEWVGEGTGSPGEGEGGFTLSPDLQNTVLVRRSIATYPATKDHPAFSHEDLMVIFHESGKTHAIYFDNEHHVIRYAVDFSKDSSALIFVSDSIASAPRFRFSYTKAPDAGLVIAFDIAPPGKPNAFSLYIDARARRRK